MLKTNKNLLIALLIITFIVLTRTILHINNNVEFITGFAIASAYFINKKYSFLVVIASLMLSDLIIGNSIIFLFTWSGFLVAPLIGSFLRSTDKKYVLAISSMGGMLSTFVFFFWSNFGVVITSNMYTRDFEGLMLSYFNGIPFLINQLVANIIITPVVFLMFKHFYADSKKVTAYQKVDGNTL